MKRESGGQCERDFDIWRKVPLDTASRNWTTFWSSTDHSKENKEERYSRVPRHSDTPYSAKGTKGKWRYASSAYRRYTDLSVMGVTNTFQLKFWI